jgi:transposase
MTREGIPVAHQIFPGNTADIEILKKVIHDTRTWFLLRQVIFVVDRGVVHISSFFTSTVQIRRIAD